MSVKVVAISLTAMLAGFAATASAALVAHWNMNESSGSIADSSVNGIAGTPVGTTHQYSQASVPAGTYGSLTVDSTTAAAFGTSIRLTRTTPADSSFSVPNAPVLENLLENTGGSSTVSSAATPTNLTVMAWIGAETLSSSFSYNLFATGNGGANGWKFGLFGTNRLRFTTNGVADINSTALPSSGRFDTGAMFHVAVTIANSAGTFYVNGETLGTFTLGNFKEESLSNYHIGDAPSGGNNFRGRIDELRIYNTSMTQAEIQAAAVTPVPEPSSFVLAGIGLLALFGSRRCRKRFEKKTRLRKS